MSPLRLTGSTSGYSQIDAPAVAGDQTFTLPGTGGTLDSLNRTGNILQVVSATKTDNFTTISTTFTDVPGLSVSITPTSASSKIFILGHITLSHWGGASMQWKLVRNSTDVAVNTANTTASTGSIYLRDGDTSLAVTGTNIVTLDSPSSTSALTYKIQVRVSSGTSASAVNRRSAAADFGGVSSIAVMEVAA